MNIQQSTTNFSNRNLRRIPSKSIEEKSSDCSFRPIDSNYDWIQQRKPPSPFQTGLRYLKLLGQLKRQTESRKKLTSLERSSPFLTNYCAPLSAGSFRSKHKSIQVDHFDDSSDKNAVDSVENSSISIEEFLITSALIFFFILILFYFQLNYRPIHCLFQRKLWYSIDLSNGYPCENSSNVEIHFVQIFSMIYQMEIYKNKRSATCFGFDILSCLPADRFSIPERLRIDRHDQLIEFCNRTENNVCSTNAMSEVRWSPTNDRSMKLVHCSCLTSTSQQSCFYWRMMYACDLQIPWLDYCLKSSKRQAICRPQIKF